MSGASRPSVQQLLDALDKHTGQNTTKKIVNQDGTYEGHWSDEKRNGFGIMIFKNKDTYVGMWKENEFHGEGVMHYENGSVYKGKWYESQRSGFGHMQYANGDEYRGFWIEDKRHGNGRMQFKDQNTYIGEWKDDKMERGTFTNQNQNWNFYGEFKDNCPGSGTLTEKSDSKESSIYSSRWRKKEVFQGKPEMLGEVQTHDSQATQQQSQMQKIIEEIKKALSFDNDLDEWGTLANELEKRGVMKF